MSVQIITNKEALYLLNEYNTTHKNKLQGDLMSILSFNAVLRDHKMHNVINLKFRYSISSIIDITFNINSAKKKFMVIKQ